MESWFDILNVIRDHIVLLDVAFQEDDINLRVFHAMDQDWDQPIGENKTSVTVEVNSLNGFLLCFLTDCRLRKIDLLSSFFIFMVIRFLPWSRCELPQKINDDERYRADCQVNVSLL